MGFHPQPKPMPKLLDKRQEQREARRVDRVLKADIKARDGHKCRCCGRRDHLEVHERKTRGAGGVVSRQNSLTVCAACHRLAQQYRILIEGQTCDGKLTFSMSQRIADAVFPHGQIPPQVHIIPEGR